MTKSSLGILGGGQLARMLALEAAPLGVEVSVLTAQGTDPAAQVVGQTRLGSLADEKDLVKFLSSIENLTFESEFVDIAKLSRCLPASVNVFPSLEAIEKIQDRLTQKRMLDRFEIPTSQWMPVENKSELERATAKFESGYVLKKRRFGYDGYGTFVVKDGKPDPLVLRKSEHGFIAECFVNFKRELAVSIVRNRQGEFITLPLVESVQQDSRCFSVLGPVEHKGLNRITTRLRKMMTELDYVGILAIEMFDTAKGLLVNELAPRVHNSAHYSQDALTCSQFEYHVRAGLDLPLPKVELLRPGFAMVNLLGESNGGKIELSHSPKGKLHWYGKNENRSGRKLGHINTVDSSPKKALKKALAWRKEFRL